MVTCFLVTHHVPSRASPSCHLLFDIWFSPESQGWWLPSHSCFSQRRGRVSELPHSSWVTDKEAACQSLSCPQAPSVHRIALLVLGAGERLGCRLKKKKNPSALSKLRRHLTECSLARLLLQSLPGDGARTGGNCSEHVQSLSFDIFGWCQEVSVTFLSSPLSSVTIDAVSLSECYWERAGVSVLGGGCMAQARVQPSVLTPPPRAKVSCLRIALPMSSPGFVEKAGLRTNLKDHGGP